MTTVSPSAESAADATDASDPLVPAPQRAAKWGPLLALFGTAFLLSVIKFDDPRLDWLLNLSPFFAASVLAIAYPPLRRVGVAGSVALIVGFRLLTDVGIGLRQGDMGDAFYNAQVFNYAALLLLAAVGLLLRNRTTERQPAEVLGKSLLAGVVFFLVSNGGVWATMPSTPEYQAYEKSLSGLLACYTAGLPFFRGTAISMLLIPVAFYGPVLALLTRPVAPIGRTAPKVAGDAKPVHA